MFRAIVVAALLAGSPARADDRPEDRPEDGPPEVTATRRLAAVGAALVPGVVLHGAGSFVLHEERAAKRLALTGGIGLAAMAIGGGAVGISGAAPSMTIWGVPMVIAGTGLWLPTWLSDIWYAAGGPRVRGAPHARSAWSVDVGTTWLHDGYRERALVRGGGRIELGRIGVGASSLVDAEGQARTFDGELRLRLWGAPSDGTAIEDASRLYVRAGARRHADDDDQVEITTGELEVGGRLDMQHIARTLHGTFLDLALGMGLEEVTYADLVSELDSLFLGRFAWGLYLGARSELTVFYDHRRDSLAGGIAANRAAGFVGSVGTNVDLRLAGPFAFIAELEIGNGWVTTAGIRYHGGPL